MNINHTYRQHLPHRGVPGVVMLWHRRGSLTAPSGKCSGIAALNLLPRVVAGI